MKTNLHSAIHAEELELRGRLAMRSSHTQHPTLAQFEKQGLVATGTIRVSKVVRPNEHLKTLTKGMVGSLKYETIRGNRGRAEPRT